MTFKVSPGIANHRYTGCRAYFETHTRSLWVCLHLCLCHTWYLLQTPPTQGKGLISHLSPPLGVFVFCPWCYPPLWPVVIRHFFPPVLPSLIFVNDHHQWPSFSISWEFATEIFVDNICVRSSSLTLICRQSIGISWEFATQSVFFLQSAVALCWAHSCGDAPAVRKTLILKGKL